MKQEKKELETEEAWHSKGNPFRLKCLNEAASVYFSVVQLIKNQTSWQHSN